jgi:UDPglucose 6-dehydrogenase
MNISIIGTGYVGLVQGACFADTGNVVLCMDIVEEKIKKLRKGVIPIYEPGLEEMVTRNMQEKRIEFTTSLEKAVDHGDIIFLCLPTPQSDDGSADLSRVLGVAKHISKIIKGYKIIVSKSTVPVGTVDKIKRLIHEGKGRDVDVISNPEFLKEGTALHDSLKPERIIIGTTSKRAIAAMSDLYAPFMRTGNPIMVMDERSAEMTKYASNSFLATKISFMNELANLCEETGADVDLVRKGMGSDSRIGQQFLFAGVGYGGSCFPKDVKALIKTAQEYKMNFELLEAVDEVNEKQKKILVRKLRAHFNGSLADRTVALWGLAFKPQTDDIREAPAISIIQELLALKAKVHAHDPIAMTNVKNIFGRSVQFFLNNYDALKGADALLVVTEWNEFRRPDFKKIKSLMRSPIILDGRNIYDPKIMKENGFIYYGIGRNNL